MAVFPEHGAQHTLFAGKPALSGHRLGIVVAQQHRSAFIRQVDIELAATWSFLKDARLSLGYSYMHGTETMEMLKRTTGNRRLHWAWLMLSVTPTFFQSKH